MSSYPENDKTVVINGNYVLSVRGFLKIIESVSETDVKYGPECKPEAESSHFLSIIYFYSNNDG